MGSATNKLRVRVGLRSIPSLGLDLCIGKRLARVRKQIATQVISALALAVWLCGCGKPETPPANAVAMVGDRFITAEAFQGELARRVRWSPDQQGGEEKRAVLEEMVKFEVLYQRALAAGYDRDPRITTELQRMIVARYKEDQLTKLRPVAASAKEIADYYTNHPQRFGTPEKLCVALIELRVSRGATADKGAEVGEKAAAVLAEAKANAKKERNFGLLASQYSEDQASRYRGGEIGWSNAGETNGPWPKAVFEAIAGLRTPGDLGPVIETPAAYYLVKLVERQPARLKPLEEVKDGIAYLLNREEAEHQTEAVYDRLKQGLTIRINSELLEKIPMPAAENRPPGLAGTYKAETKAP